MNAIIKILSQQFIINFQIDIRTNRTIDIDTSFVIDGKITIIDSVEDNIENLCEIIVKKNDKWKDLHTAIFLVY